ncbi:GntR family transcriptional regulator [Pseudonocardia xinjiangensis]|uniref:GntR family transcriptional regulator n=1 Tax=Pseudonocardia xinjiangensis TaxID=75289 RepID=UPI0028AFA837|nr:GntR family transcriptional regulator [Pseudonocardia xinjiangensis]
MGRGEPGHRSARVVVYEQLRRRIVSGELPPGAPLSENDLAAELSVSRTPVRESLILLADEDLVQVFPQLGSFVSRVDIRHVADAQFVREAIEIASLRDAADRLDAPALAALRDVLARQRAAGDDVEEFFRLDEEFHQMLLGVGGHAGAWRAVQSAKVHLDRARRLGLRTVSPVAPLVAQHTAVVDALAAGDPEAAETALREHLRAVFDDIERIRERSPELFTSEGTSRPARRNITVWR